MSRTWKDRPYRVKFPEKQKEHEIAIPYQYYWLDLLTDEQREFTRYFRLALPGTKTKKKKSKNTEYWWLQTPMWWIHENMIVPQRRKGRAWEHKVLLEDLEETDPPEFSNKPYEYYW